MRKQDDRAASSQRSRLDRRDALNRSSRMARHSE
jgi:hypothetical protein